MDPNETLRKMRDALRTIRRVEASGDPDKYDLEARDMAVVEVCDGAEALDEWLSRGGFAPDAWRSSR